MAVTINDVAKVSGVSIATVSRVINNQPKVGATCRARVQKVIKELGYKASSPTKSVVKNKVNNVGLIVPKISMEFFGRLAAGADLSSRENNAVLLICNSLFEEKAELEAIKNLHSKGCDSIVIHSKYLTDKTLIELSKKYKGLVIINRFIHQIANRCVWFDNTNSSIQLVDFLYENNHKNLAFITSIYHNKDPQLRIMGARQAMMFRGDELDEEMVIEGTANIQGGRETIFELLKRNKIFTAVVAYNDLMAVGAIHALIENGYKIPEDVSVVGCDDSSVCRVCIPEITTVKYPIEDMAQYAVNLSIKLLENDENITKKTHLFTSELIVRDSVKLDQT